MSRVITPQIKEARRLWRIKNAEHLRLYEANRRNKQNAARRARYAANPTKFKEAIKRFKTSSIGMLYERRRILDPHRAEYRKIYLRQHYQLNKDKYLAARRNRQLRLKGAEGYYTVGDIKAMYAAQNGLCYYCRKPLFNDFHIEHKTPVCRKGTNWPDNLCCACKKCNDTKGVKTEQEYKQYIKETTV